MLHNNLMRRVIFISTFIVVGIIAISIPRLLIMPVSNAEAILKTQGYTEIQLTGVDRWSCLGDLYSSGFVAKTPSGDKITGAVCASVFKAATIRIVNINWE